MGRLYYLRCGSGRASARRPCRWLLAALAVGGLRQGDGNCLVAGGVHLHVPALVAALGDSAGAVYGGTGDGEGMVSDPGVAGLHVLAEAQLEGEVAAVVVRRYVGEAGRQ